MKRNHAMEELEACAAAALREALKQVSTIKVRDLRGASQGGGRGMVAHIEVLGHSHTLACKIEPSGELGDVERALAKLAADAARLGADATPVLIAPCLSAEAQALCKQSQAGYLDLEGNTRLVIGEVFVVRRSLPARAVHPSSLSQRLTAGVMPGFSTARAESPSGGSRAAA